MRKMILTLALLYPAAAFAQAPPAGHDGPSSHGWRQAAGTGQGVKKPAAARKRRRQEESAKSVAQKLQACGDIDDATKERLQCYDAIFAPQPKPKAPAAKGRQ